MTPPAGRPLEQPQVAHHVDRPFHDRGAVGELMSPGLGGPDRRSSGRRTPPGGVGSAASGARSTTPPRNCCATSSGRSIVIQQPCRRRQARDGTEHHAERATGKRSGGESSMKPRPVLVCEPEPRAEPLEPIGERGRHLRRVPAVAVAAPPRTASGQRAAGRSGRGAAPRPRFHARARPAGTGPSGSRWCGPAASRRQRRLSAPPGVSSPRMTLNWYSRNFGWTTRSPAAIRSSSQPSPLAWH